MYKADRQGKMNEFEERFEREFVKKEEKDIGYEFHFYVIHYIFFLLTGTVLERRCINC